MPASSAAAKAVVDGVFRALSDPTRRDVLERLSRKPSSVSELARGTRMALPSFVAHLKVLEGAGLVRSKKTGRVRTYELAPARLRVAEDWLGRQRSLWERRLDQLDDYLLRLKKERSA
jgi:DNA-binding transcriptional ArsR family regulator